MRYKFSKEVKSELDEFESYLRSKKYSVDTITQTKNYAGVYLTWLSENEMRAEDMDYKSFMDFIFHLKSTRPISLVRRIILAVRHYYDSLGIDRNPASGIYIRGHQRSILSEVVPYSDLEEACQNYQALDDRSKRNKVILGLLIYQGIKTGELNQLEPKHIQLKEGKIYIPSKGKTNSRILDLHAKQLLELQEYLLLIRPRMLDNLEAYRSGKKPKQINPLVYDKLFFSVNGSAEIKNSVLHTFKAIRRSYPKITSAKIIRSTVIAEWLQSKDIRIVQYMAGHRYVSSTERYNVYNLQELKDALKLYHPLQ